MTKTQTHNIIKFPVTNRAAVAAANDPDYSAAAALRLICDYLRENCRMKLNILTGACEFQPKTGFPDRTLEVIDFFEENPEFKVGVSRGARFLTLTEKALQNLNSALAKAGQAPVITQTAVLPDEAHNPKDFGR